MAAVRQAADADAVLLYAILIPPDAPMSYGHAIGADDTPDYRHAAEARSSVVSDFVGAGSERRD